MASNNMWHWSTALKFKSSKKGLKWGHFSSLETGYNRNSTNEGTSTRLHSLAQMLEVLPVVQSFLLLTFKSRWITGGLIWCKAATARTVSQNIFIISCCLNRLVSLWFIKCTTCPAAKHNITINHDVETRIALGPVDPPVCAQEYIELKNLLRDHGPVGTPRNATSPVLLQT